MSDFGEQIVLDFLKGVFWIVVAGCFIVGAAYTLGKYHGRESIKHELREGKLKIEVKLDSSIIIK